MKDFVDDRGYSIFDLFPIKKGQINYSELNPGVIKAFHRHKEQTDYWICLEGDMLVNLVSQDKSDKQIERVVLSSRIPQVLEIKPGIWHGYMALNNKPAKLLYYVTNKYNSREPDEERVEYNKFGDIWKVENK